MDLAVRAVRRSGAPTVEPEHVLYGLMEEDESVASYVLSNFGFEVTELQPGTGASSSPKGPRTVPIEWSAGTVRCIERAMEEAKSLAHNYMRTEHLLIGIALSGGEVVADRLQQRGVTPDEIRDEVLSILGHDV